MSGKRQKDWCRGYFCAVALLIREEGTLTTIAKELFQGGGTANVQYADAIDQEVFREHGLIKPPAPAQAPMKEGTTP